MRRYFVDLRHGELLHVDDVGSMHDTPELAWQQAIDTLLQVARITDVEEDFTVSVRDAGGKVLRRATLAFQGEQDV